MEVETADAIYIFEFKVGAKPVDAISQIKEMDYGEKYKAISKSVFLIGGSIDQNERTLGEWFIEKMRR